MENRFLPQHLLRESKRPCSVRAAVPTNSGVTLIEIMILGVIAAIVVSILVPRLKAARIIENEHAAVLALQAIASAQQLWKQELLSDRNHDGEGEYAFLGDLLGGGKTQDGQRQKILELPDARRTKVDGIFERYGYLFRIYLPDAQAMPVGVEDHAKVDRNLGARHFVACAWPRKFGSSGIRCFAVTARGLVVGSSNSPQRYSGLHAPSGLAAYAPGDQGMAGPLGSSDSPGSNFYLAVDQQHWSLIPMDRDKR